MGGFFPGPGFRDLIELTTDTAEVGAWDTRPYSFNAPRRIEKIGAQLFIAGEHGAHFGPTRHGLVVYDPKGFSVFQRIEQEGDAINLRLAADQGRQVMVQRTSDFKTWTGVSTNVAWEGVLEVEDPATPADGPVFYRAKTTH